jgi:hypothetical protein
VHRCPEGHVERVWYNSCRHRSCPQCEGIRISRWLDRQQARMLNCSHFHVVFTVSNKLDDLWRVNSRLMTNLLFRVSRDTLFAELGREGRFFVGTPGIVASLHTWGRNLHFHPHLHCLVTGGGLTNDGRWMSVENGFLLPFRRVRMVFRDRFVRALRRHLEAGELVLPRNWTVDRAEHLFSRVARQKWNVNLGEQYAHGRGVLKYLSRYVRGGSISNKRMVAYEAGRVTFAYRDHRDGKDKALDLPANEFMWRVLQHVPEPGMQVVRYYGLYSRQSNEKLNHCKSLLGQPPTETPRPRNWEEYWKRWTGLDPLVCPVCRRRLIGRRLPPIARNRSAPKLDVRDAA